MLARLLRWMILVQILLGGVLGYLVFRHTSHPQLGALAWALALPFTTMVLGHLVSALQSKGDEPWGFWWRSVWGESWASIQVFLFRQPWTLAQPTWLPATGATARIPVVLVHGYMCNHRTWDSLIKTLRANGHPVLAVNKEPLFASIDDYVPIVDAAVNELCKQTGSNQVALVGHSMGGLSIRAWMRACGTERVARVITLGTPHAGTKIAAGSPTHNGRQMRWQSPWIAELSASETQAIVALMRIAITPQDNIVYPQRAQTMTGVTPVIFEGIGHLQMCLDAKVIAWVTQQLAELGPRTPSGAPA
jgi:triacylglycerol lipase